MTPESPSAAVAPSEWEPLPFQRIGLVAWHVFKESVRDRVLYAIAAFALLLVAASVLIGQITAGEDVKIIKDFGLATIEAAGLLMTIFIGVGLVSREIERRSILALLAKPIARWEFIVGKYTGLVLTIVVNLAAMAAALYLMLAWLDLRALPIERRAWDAPALDPRLMLAVVMIGAEMALLTAVALFFSAFSSSAFLSITFTIGIFIAGQFSDDLKNFGSIVDVSPAIAAVVSMVGSLMPSFSAFDIKAQVVHGLHIDPWVIGGRLLYAAIYAAALLVAAGTAFSKREFK